MKLKILIVLLIIIMVILPTVMLIYLYNGNISSKVPEHILKECNVKEEKYRNRSVFIMSSKEEANSGKVIYYLHGGSYIAELSGAHWKFLSKLVQDTGATIVVPDYPLAPQYKYTDTFNMVEPLYKEIAKKVEKQNLIVMGDSAGGGMALALMQKIDMNLTQENEIKEVSKLNEGKETNKVNGANETNKKTEVSKIENKPCKLILISPWLDASMENPQIKDVQEKDKMLSSELLKIAAISYVGAEENNKEYFVSPIYGPLENLEQIENITIFTGTNDILNPDVHILVEKAKMKRNRNRSTRN